MRHARILQGDDKYQRKDRVHFSCPYARKVIDLVILTIN